MKFGVFCTTPGVALSRNVSSKIALKMLFTGEPISANQALQHGLISEVVEVDENDNNSLANRVDEIGLQIAANSKHIVALGKKAFYQQIEIENLNKAYDLGIYFY